MRTFEKPVVVVSRCLGFAKCRYNGQVIADDFVSQLEPYVTYKVVCPEVEIGLGIPRFPIRLVEDRLVQPKTNKDVTEEMNSFSEKYLHSLEEVDGFILKYGSPSCGLSNVRRYSKGEKPSIVGKGPGVFGGHVQKKFPGTAIEDEGRLNNFRIREHYLMRLFALASFRAVKKENSIKTLIDYHAQNKFLFMACDQVRMRKMGKIVGTHKKELHDSVFSEYESELQELLSHQPKVTSYINVFYHIFGYYSSELNEDEKEFFENTIELYRAEKIPLSSVIRVMRAEVVRFKDPYLLGQTIFEPFPEQLIELKDSGKKLRL